MDLTMMHVPAVSQEHVTGIDGSLTYFTWLLGHHFWLLWPFLMAPLLIPTYLFYLYTQWECQGISLQIFALLHQTHSSRPYVHLQYWYFLWLSNTSLQSRSPASILESSWMPNRYFRLSKVKFNQISLSSQRFPIQVFPIVVNDNSSLLNSEDKNLQVSAWSSQSRPLHSLQINPVNATFEIHAGPRHQHLPPT